MLPYALLLLRLASLASSLTGRQASSAQCPFNCPVNLNTTESQNGLIFTIASNNRLTKNRAIQFRSVTPSYNSNVSSPAQVAAIDSTSPVLLGKFWNGALYSENRSDVNQLYDLGPTAALKLVAEDASGANVSRWAVEFAQTKTLDNEFYLLAPTDDGTYGWYHEGPTEHVNGFILCAQDEDSWYQLFYQSYVQTPPEAPGREYAGVRVSLRMQEFVQGSR